jgi:putative ABC transport system permease protein
MNLLESVRIAIRGLAANKMRSVLTMLGIIIGVGAVITLVSVGQGVEQEVTKQFQSVGTNLLFVMPGQMDTQGSRSTSSANIKPLTVGDAEAIADPRNVPDLVAVSAETASYQTVVRGGKEMVVIIRGVLPNYQEVRNLEVDYGSFIDGQQYDGRDRVAVLGSKTLENFFPDDAYPIGQTITIKNMPFKVIGVMKEKGGSAFGSEDDVVFIPLTTLQTRLAPERQASGEYRVSVIYAQVVSEDRMDSATQDITDLLRQRHSITFRDDDDFTVISQSDILSVFSSIFGMLTIYLGAIAAISLLVGGIGIMNIMLVSVTERTREIGIRKAMGAKRSDILLQFLVEAMVLSMIGGAFGIGLGTAGSQAVAQLAKINTFVSAGAVLLATGFSAAVGLFFGIYPATRAARLNPIDALRYE